MKCNYCNKEISTKTFATHIRICKKRYDLEQKEILKEQEEIEKNNKEESEEEPEEESEEESEGTNDFKKMNIRDLKQYAKEQGYKNCSNLPKNELVEFLINKG